MYFYNLPFALDTLRKGQRKDTFFSGIINYLEDNHLPTNIKLQQSIIAEAENYWLFNTFLFHFTVKSSKTVEHKLALCIPLELSNSIFELYHSGLMTSHQGLARTYYKIRQDFVIRNLCKYLYLYIMSCGICSARRDIPFNQKQWSWSSKVIHDFNIIELISMDLKVMPTSFHGYNYPLVMHCNHSDFVITDTLKTRKASEVAESIFQKLICVHGTNIKEIHCDLDTAFKNEIVSTLFTSLGIQFKFCSVQSHQSNPLNKLFRVYQTFWSIILPNMATFGVSWLIWLHFVWTFFEVVICRILAVMKLSMAENRRQLAICNLKGMIWFVHPSIISQIILTFSTNAFMRCVIL